MYRNRELEELLEYCKKMEEYERTMAIEYMTDGYGEESTFHKGEQSAYKDLKNKILNLID